MEEGIISESKSKVRKVELDEEENDFECYDKSDEQPVHVDVDKELAVDKPTLALLPNRLEEVELNNIGETGDGDSNSLRRSNQLFKPPERLGSVPFF